MPSVIYTSLLNKNTLSVIKILNKKYSWEPKVLINPGNLKKITNDSFPKSFHVDESELRSGSFNFSNFKKIYPIDEIILKKLSNYESNFINWIEDSNGRNFSSEERRRFYYELLMYCNTLVNNHKPNLFFSFSWPHTISDYALYLICKHIYSIPVIFIDIIAFFNSKHRLVNLSYDNMSATIKKNNNIKEKFFITSEIEDYIKNLRQKEKPFVHSYLNDFYNEHQTSFKKIFQDFLILVKLIITFRIGKKSKTYFKKNTKPFGKESLMNYFEYFIFKYKTLLKNLNLKRIYNSLSDSINYDRNFIYFPAPYQPEAISNIAPGKYEDPFLILDMISAYLPKDWKVYYKEHPSTFLPYGKGSLSKNKNFYKKLRAYKFIKIVPYNESTFKLIDQSKAVVTAGGTAGWEALVRGKPSLLFGSLWYQECSEVFKIEKCEDLKNSIEKIQTGFIPNLDKVKEFCQNIHSSLLLNGELINKKKTEIKVKGELDEDLIHLARDLNNIFNKFYR